MKEYQPFVDRLNLHLSKENEVPTSLWKSTSYFYLDGLAAEELRNLVDIKKRRESGAFFTDSDLALEVISKAGLSFGSNVTFYDPTVGAGNLLLAGWKFAAKAQIEFSLLGTDVHKTFVETAILRLTIQKRLYKKAYNPIFNISVNDGLYFNSYYEQATHILTNPPFNLIEVDDTVTWCKGKASAAAIFIEKIIYHIRTGVQVIAILPDVLRSGSRYAKWRELIEHHCNITYLKKLGQFDKFADVDVFALTMTKKAKPETTHNFAWSNLSKYDSIIGDYFDVCVGHVVDNRDYHLGPERPFFVSRGLPGWEVVKQSNRTRRFSGQSVEGPFVVIKRTSRMGDSHRAIATIINTKESVFIDNHLLIAKPKSGKMSDCRKLVRALRTVAVDEWINDQIRCRHLTISIIKRVPYAP